MTMRRGELEEIRLRAEQCRTTAQEAVALCKALTLRSERLMAASQRIFDETTSA